jgi:hypothetical protein
MRASNLPLLTAPTFSPKPRRMPRMLLSTSRSLAISSLRAVSRARISWAMGALTWTGRNQPMRISCAMPRASFLSVLTVIALSAAPRVRLRRPEDMLDVAGLDADRRPSGLDQTGVQPLRQRSCLQADAGEPEPARGEEADQRLALAPHLGFTHDLSAPVHDADAAPFQRHVDRGIVLHGCPSVLMLGAAHRTPFHITVRDSRLLGKAAARPDYRI